MRTTLVNGVQTLNEVETFPRHHEQRRAIPCLLRGTWIVKENLRVAARERGETDR